MAMLDDGPFNPVTRFTDTFQEHVGSDDEWRNTNTFDVETLSYEFIEVDDDDRPIYDVELEFSRTEFGDWVIDEHPAWDKLPDHAQERIAETDRWRVHNDKKVDEACENLEADLDEPPVEVLRGELLESGDLDLGLTETASATVTLRVACEGFDRDWSNGGCRLRFGSGSTEWGLQQTLSEGSSGVSCVTWHPDGDYIAYGTLWDDGNVYVHEVGGTWSLVETLANPGTQTEDIAFSPDGAYLAYASDNNTVHVHEVGDGWGEITDSPLDEAGASVLSVAWMPDMSFIAYGSSDDNVYVHEVGGSWGEIADSPLDGGSNPKVAFSPDAAYLAFGTDNNTVHVHEVGDGWGEIADSPFTTPASSVPAVAFSPDGAYLAYASLDDNVYVHEVGDGWGEIVDSPFEKSGSGVLAVAWSKADAYLAYGGQDSNVYVHEVGDGWGEIADSPLNEAGGDVRDVSWALEDDLLAYGSNDDNVYIHNTPGFPEAFESTGTAHVGPITATGTTVRGKNSTAIAHVAPITAQGVRGPQTRATSGTTYTGPIVASGERQASADSPQSDGVLVDGELRAQLLQGQPSPKRGETTTIRLRTEDPGSSGKYKRLRQYLEYAGEADYGTLLGGEPFVREHPLDAWPVESHVVSIEPGAEIYDWDGVWGLLVDGSDDSVITGESGNPYVVDLEVVVLARLSEYDTRAALLADLSPTLNQL